MLKAVKHLSMSPTLLEVLQNANAIDILVKILDEQSLGPYSTVCPLCYGEYRRELRMFAGNVQSRLPDLL